MLVPRDGDGEFVLPTRLPHGEMANAQWNPLFSFTGKGGLSLMRSET